jgi:hypothetical protein
MASTTLGTQRIQKTRPERVVGEIKDPAMELALGKGDLWEPEGNIRWRAIICLEGAIWVTQQRDFRDHVLTAGEMFLISQRGKVVVQALVDARMQLTPSLATTPRPARFFENTILP